MNKLYRMRYPVVLLFLILSFSCVEKRSTEKETNNPESTQTITTDTLNFTSGVRSIFQDSKGNYWFGSHNEGVSYYNGQIFEYFTTNEGLAHNQIRTIQEDKRGNIWFGTSNGVSVYDGGQFRNYITRSNNPILDWNETSGDLWFYAGEEDGISRFNGTSMNYLLFPKPENYSSKNSYGVTGISKDKDGTVWIATYAALFNYNGISTNIFDNEKLELKDNDVLHIRSVLVDSKGRIWIGNNGIGVLLMENGKTINFSKVQGLIHENSVKNGNPSPPGTMEHVFVIEEDSEGNIWFGDRDTGVWRYDGESLINFDQKDGLESNYIWSIYQSKQGELWFGGADPSGVYIFDGTSFERKY
ncbi:MAG: two-component regulator propeller domain-containing protein [Balneola sp.]